MFSNAFSNGQIQPPESEAGHFISIRRSLDVAQGEELLCDLGVVIGTAEDLGTLAEGVYGHGESGMGVARPTDAGLVVDDVGQRDGDRVVAAVQEGLLVSI